MSEFHVGQSKLFCRYLYSVDILDKARDQGINLSRHVRNQHYDEKFVEFVCENAVYDWDNVYDIYGKELEFSVTYLYTLFESDPRLFIRFLRFCSKPDNFDMVQR